MKTKSPLVKAGKAHKPAQTGKFVDRDLCSVNPNKEQFEPREPNPVRQHYKMAGGQ